MALILELIRKKIENKYDMFKILMEKVNNI
jgi:hypothetical protein